MTRALNMQYFPLRDSLQFEIKNFRFQFHDCLLQQPSRVHLLIVF